VGAAAEPLPAEEVVEAAVEPSLDAEREEVVVAGKPSVDMKRMRNRGFGRSRQEKDTELDMTLFWIVFYIFLFSIFLC
jgi:hypothetical protein